MQEKNGPLFGGNKFTGLDAILGPKVGRPCSAACTHACQLQAHDARDVQLKHTIIAVKEIKKFDVPKSLKGIWCVLPAIR